VLTADPHAEPFYLHCGAVRTGEKVSPVDPGCILPAMEFLLLDSPIGSGNASNSMG
jgi:hypothetical protein